MFFAATIFVLMSAPNQAEYWRHAIVDKPAPAVYVEIKTARQLCPFTSTRRFGRHVRPVGRRERPARTGASPMFPPRPSPLLVGAEPAMGGRRRGRRRDEFRPRRPVSLHLRRSEQPAYRRRFDDFHEIDFPRVPTPPGAFVGPSPLSASVWSACTCCASPAGPLPAFPADGDALVRSPRYAPPTSKTPPRTRTPFPAGLDQQPSVFRGRPADNLGNDHRRLSRTRQMAKGSQGPRAFLRRYPNLSKDRRRVGGNRRRRGRHRRRHRTGGRVAYWGLTPRRPPRTELDRFARLAKAFREFTRLRGGKIV